MRSFATIALVALSLASGCNPADPVAADPRPNATECGCLGWIPATTQRTAALVA